MLDRKLNLGFVFIVGFFATVLTIAGCSGGGSSSGTAGGDPVEVGVLEKAPADISQLPGGHGQSFGNQAIHCSSAKISWPSANTSIDQVGAVQYTLLPEGCGLTADENLKWGAYYSELALGRSAQTKGFTAYIGTSRAKANIPCAGGDDSTQMVHYDFRQLGIALGDSALDKYKISITHKVKPGDCDGDGTPNNQDGNNGTSPLCTTAKIIWPNDEIAVGNNADIEWDLMPANCAITEAQNKNIKLRAVSGKIQSTSNAKGVAAQVTTIRIPCDPKLGTGPRAVAYDFTELGQALADTAGGYKHTITHPASSKGCSGDGGGTDPGPDEPNQCPADATGTYPNCTCNMIDIEEWNYAWLTDQYYYDKTQNLCVSKGVQCTGLTLDWPSSVEEFAEGKGVDIPITSLTPAGCTWIDSRNQMWNFFRVGGGGGGSPTTVNWPSYPKLCSTLKKVRLNCKPDRSAPFTYSMFVSRQNNDDYVISNKAEYLISEEDLERFCVQEEAYSNWPIVQCE